MSQSPFTVSVVLPVYNGGEFLSEAIENILQQTCRPQEIIVVDDGSTDDSRRIAEGYGDAIRYVFQDNAGPAAARNRGIEMAQGEIIAFLDVDDLWPSNKLELQLAYFSKKPDLEIVIGRVQFMLLSEGADGGREFKEFEQPALGVNLGAGLYRKSVFEKLGYFDPTMRQSEDVDYFMRIRENGIEMIIIEPVTLYYRIHETNISREHERQKTLFLQAIRKSLNRRQKGKGGSLPGLRYSHE